MAEDRPELPDYAGLADVAIVQATDFGNREDGADHRTVDRPAVGAWLSTTH